MVRNNFFSDGLQIYLVFILINKYLPFFSSTTKIFSWIYKGMSEESNKNPSTPGNSFTPKWAGYPFLEVKFHGNYLRQDSAPFLHENIVNFGAYLELWS